MKGPEKVPLDFDPTDLTLGPPKLVKPHKEAMVADLDVCPGMLESSVLASDKERSPVDDRESHSSQDSRSLMNVVHSVSTFMFSMLQSGWRLCRWKVCTVPSLTLRLIPLSLLQRRVFGSVFFVLFCWRQGPV